MQHPESSQRHMNFWELRVLVLLSLALQIVLIGFGNRRKYITSKWMTFVLWFAYLFADWVATFSLGILFKHQGDNKNNTPDSGYVIMAFWAPFLLLHVGGPDTITAYSLEDNELWRRHFLGLVVQGCTAVYVVIRSWKSTQLNPIAVLMFVSGFIKFGERTWVLRSASNGYFRKSLLPRPDAGPNYPKFMEEYCLRETEGFDLSWIASELATETVVPHGNVPATSVEVPDSVILNVAFDFFKTYKPLFADLILSFQDLEKSQSFFQGCTWSSAFKVSEVELGFVYDVLLTKATISCSCIGVFLRFLSLTSTVASLAAFSFIDRHEYSNIDVGITFLLLVGAIGLELFAILVLLSSDWGILWFSNNENVYVNTVRRFVSRFNLTRNKRWSNQMGQQNLLRSCFKTNRLSCIYRIRKAQRYATSVAVSPELKECIFQHLVEKSEGATNFKTCKLVCGYRGEQVLQKNNCVEKLSWSLDVEFDHSILLWHIATDICFYSDSEKEKGKESVVSTSSGLSKLVSDYMVSILVSDPSMLTGGIGQIRFQDTRAEAMEFIQDTKTITNSKMACKKLLQVDT